MNTAIILVITHVPYMILLVFIVSSLINLRKRLDQINRRL